MMASMVALVVALSLFSAVAVHGCGSYCQPPIDVPPPPPVDVPPPPLVAVPPPPPVTEPPPPPVAVPPPPPIAIPPPPPMTVPPPPPVAVPPPPPVAFPPPPQVTVSPPPPVAVPPPPPVAIPPPPSVAVPPPPFHGGGGHGGQCSIDVLKLRVCANILSGLLGLIKVGVPAYEECCPLLQGLVDLDAAVCLCTTVEANVLDIVHLRVPVGITVLLNHCGKTCPSHFTCPGHY